MMLTSLKQSFPTEFLNRIDEILIFQRLGEKELTSITELLLADVKKRMEGLGIQATFDVSVAEEIARIGNDPHYGARPLRRAVTHLVEDRLSDALLSGEISTWEKVFVCFRDGEISIQKSSQQ